jgi:acyl carrier protein
VRRKLTPDTDSLERVRAAVRSVLPQLPAEALTPGARLMDDLGVDSLKVAELSMALEEAYGRPVFLGDVFARVDDPSQLTLAQLAALLAEELP